MSNICPECNEVLKGNPAFHAKKHGGVAVAERPEPRSRKGRERRQIPVLTPLEQIRPLPSGTSGASAYYLRPGGATIRDVLIIYPNGGVPENTSAKMRHRFGMNADEYRAKQARKGFTYLGTKLDRHSIGLIVKEIAKNRQEAIYEMEDMIEECDHVMQTTSDPKWIPLYRQQKSAAERRLAMLTAQWDPEVLAEELNEISRAQRLANVDPNVRAVISEMIGEANNEMMAYFANAKRPAKNVVRGGGSDDDFADGQDFIDAD